MRTGCIWKKNYVDGLQSCGPYHHFYVWLADFIKCVKSPTFTHDWCFHLNNRTSSTMFMASNFHCSSCIMRITLSYNHHHHNQHLIGIVSSHTDDFISPCKQIHHKMPHWSLPVAPAIQSLNNTMKQSGWNNPKKSHIKQWLIDEWCQQWGW